jgi:hypothetical protein
MGVELIATNAHYSPKMAQTHSRNVGTFVPTSSVYPNSVIYIWGTLAAVLSPVIPIHDRIGNGRPT